MQPTNRSTHTGTLYNSGKLGVTSRTCIEEVKLVLRDDGEGEELGVVEGGRERVTHELCLGVLLVLVDAVLDADAAREAALVDLGAHHFDLNT